MRNTHGDHDDGKHPSAGDDSRMAVTHGGSGAVLGVKGMYAHTLSGSS